MQLVFVGDSPYGPTGLGRILRDLSTRTKISFPTLFTEVIGWEPGPTFAGRDRYTAHQDTKTWGASTLAAWWPEHVDRREWGIVFSIWDPARAFGLHQAQAPNALWWGYFPVDAHNLRGTFGGPAAAVVRQYDRALAYTAYGAQVLSTLRPDVSHLPHGIDPLVFHPRRGQQEAWDVVVNHLAPVVSPESLLIGCVATNQPRKDLGLLFQTIARLARIYPEVRLWLHTDQEVTAAWSIPQLIADFGLGGKVRVTTYLEDDDLAALYSYCAVTIAPGLGEGFGYPIVESLACGTPVVHGTYGGGTELVPSPQWIYPHVSERLEGPYGVVRPVYQASDVVNAVEQVLEWQRQEPEVVQAYCVGSVQHLHWSRLWPKWKTWIQEGLDQL